MKKCFDIQDILEDALENFCIPLVKAFFKKYLFCWSLLGFLPYLMISVMITVNIFTWKSWGTLFHDLLMRYNYKNNKIVIAMERTIY